MLRAVVLVLKFADDLLDGVLDGDQSGDAAIFVDDDRHMLPGLLHGVEQVIHRLRLGNQHRLPDDGGDIALRGGGIERRGAHGVLEIRHADQIVDVVADHRHAGETGPGAQTQHVGKCGRAVHADHVGARHHDLAGQRLRQRQHVAQHLGDFRIEIIGLHQAVDGGTPLFELNLLQLLVVGQVRFLGATLLALLLARLRKRRDRGGEPDQSRQIEHDVDRLAGSRGPRAETMPTISANRKPHSSCSQIGASSSDATHATSTPSNTLHVMRKNAQLPEVACRLAMSRCTVWILPIFFIRMNWLVSVSVCTSRILLFSPARVTRPTALSAAAMLSDSQTSSAATTTNATTRIIVDVSVNGIGILRLSSCVQRR